MTRKAAQKAQGAGGKQASSARLQGTGLSLQIRAAQTPRGEGGGGAGSSGLRLGAGSGDAHPHGRTDTTQGAAPRASRSGALPARTHRSREQHAGSALRSAQVRPARPTETHRHRNVRPFISQTRAPFTADEPPRSREKGKKSRGGRRNNGPEAAPPPPPFSPRVLPPSHPRRQEMSEGGAAGQAEPRLPSTRLEGMRGEPPRGAPKTRQVSKTQRSAAQAGTADTLQREQVPAGAQAIGTPWQPPARGHRSGWVPALPPLRVRPFPPSALEKGARPRGGGIPLPGRAEKPGKPSWKPTLRPGDELKGPFPREALGAAAARRAGGAGRAPGAQPVRGARRGARGRIGGAGASPTHQPEEARHLLPK